MTSGGNLLDGTWDKSGWFNEQNTPLLTTFHYLLWPNLVRRWKQVQAIRPSVNCKNSILFLILKGGKSQKQLPLEIYTVLTMTLPHTNNSLNRQKHHTAVIFNQSESFFPLYTTLYPSFTKTPAKDFTACLRQATQIKAFSARKQKRKRVWWWCKSVERERRGEKRPQVKQQHSHLWAHGGHWGDYVQMKGY